MLTALSVAVTGCIAFLLLGVHGPDLQAQLARAQAAADGSWLWWSGWYGGIDLAPYSVVSAPLMEVIGVGVAGILGCVGLSLGLGALLRDVPRARLATAAGSLCAVMNLFSGRVTYGLGMAAAVWSVVLLRRSNLGAALGCALAASLLSPLAGLSLAIMVLAAGRFVAAPKWQAWVCVVTLAPIALTAVLFPGPSVMPFSVVDALPLLATEIVLWEVATGTVARRGLLVIGLVSAAAFVVPSSLGVNATRLLMLAAPALVLAASSRRRRTTIAVLLLTLIWPTTITVSDLVSGSGPSSKQEFYAPLLAHLPLTAVSGRVEVIDPATHGADVWVASRLAIARGWERQIDVADNPLFYDGSLTSASYRDWLNRLAVQYVALPHARLDYGSTAEAGLVSGGLPYLTRLWSSDTWDLYRVNGAQPVISGPAQVTSMTAKQMAIDVTGPGPIFVRESYSGSLRVFTPAGMRVGTLQAAGAGTSITVPGPGSYVLR